MERRYSLLFSIYSVKNMYVHMDEHLNPTEEKSVKHKHTMRSYKLAENSLLFSDASQNVVSFKERKFFSLIPSPSSMIRRDQDILNIRKLVNFLDHSIKGRPVNMKK